MFSGSVKAGKPWFDLFHWPLLDSMCISWLELKKYHRWYFVYFPSYLNVQVHLSYIFKSALCFLAFFFVLLWISQLFCACSCVHALCQHQYSFFFYFFFFNNLFFFPPLVSTNRRCLSVDDKSESVQPVHSVGTTEEPEPAGTYGLYLHTGRHIS